MTRAVVLKAVTGDIKGEGTNHNQLPLHTTDFEVRCYICGVLGLTSVLTQSVLYCEGLQARAVPE